MIIMGLQNLVAVRVILKYFIQGFNQGEINSP